MYLLNRLQMWGLVLWGWGGKGSKWKNKNKNHIVYLYSACAWNFLSMPPHCSESSQPREANLCGQHSRTPFSLACRWVNQGKALGKTRRMWGWMLFPAFLATPGWQWLHSSKEGHRVGGTSLPQRPLFPHLLGAPFAFKIGWRWWHFC